MTPWVQLLLGAVIAVIANLLIGAISVGSSVPMLAMVGLWLWLCSGLWLLLTWSPACLPTPKVREQGDRVTIWLRANAEGCTLVIGAALMWAVVSPILLSSLLSSHRAVLTATAIGVVCLVAFTVHSRRVMRGGAITIDTRSLSFDSPKTHIPLGDLVGIRAQAEALILKTVDGERIFPIPGASTVLLEQAVVRIQEVAAPRGAFRPSTTADREAMSAALSEVRDRIPVK